MGEKLGKGFGECNRKNGPEENRSRLKRRAGMSTGCHKDRKNRDRSVDDAEGGIVEPFPPSFWRRSIG